MEKTILQNNIEVLNKYNQLLLTTLFAEKKEFDFRTDDKIEEIESRSGVSTLTIKNGERKYLLHSKYDPVIEADKLIKNIDYNKDNLIIVFGLGLGYHLLQLKDKISEDTRVFVVEYDLDVLKYTMKNTDISEIFNNNQFKLVAGEAENIELILHYYFGFNIYNIAFNMEIVILPNYINLYGNRINESITQIKQRVSTTLISFGNALDDIITGFRNNYKNIDAFIESNSVNEIRDKFKDKPAIILAAGPSLDKNVHHFPKTYGNAVIVTCDTGMKVCEKYNIKPDAVASIERDKEVYEFYYEDKKFDEDIVLVGPGLLWPNIFDEYNGKHIMMAKQPDGIEGWWHDHFENTDFVNIGQSCATTAFAIAKEAGCNPIILIGQDLAYTGGKFHGEDAHSQYEGENNDREFDGVYLKDYDGNLLRSNKVYELFKLWYEYQILANPQIKVIDATEGGAYIKGTEIMTFEDAIEKYCTEPLEKHINDYLEDILIDNCKYISKYDEIMIDIDIEIERLKKIKSMSKEHYELLEAISKKYEIEECSEKQLEEIVLKMQNGDKVVQYILNEENILKTFYRQIVVQTIIHVKQIGNELTAENVKKNYVFQKNLMYIIKDSTDIIIDEYMKAKEFIKSKKDKRLMID